MFIPIPLRVFVPVRTQREGVSSLLGEAARFCASTARPCELRGRGPRHYWLPLPRERAGVRGGMPQDHRGNRMTRREISWPAREPWRRQIRAGIEEAHSGATPHPSPLPREREPVFKPRGHDRPRLRLEFSSTVTDFALLRKTRQLSTRPPSEDFPQKKFLDRTSAHGTKLKQASSSRI